MDEVTQWLIEEAAFAALEVEEQLELSGEGAQSREEELLLQRHAEMQALRDSMRGR